MSRIRDDRENAASALLTTRAGDAVFPESVKKAATGSTRKGSTKNRVRGAATRPTRVAHIKAHEHSVAERQEYVPGLLVVRCKENVVANVPDIYTARIAAVQAFTLPQAVEE